MKITVINGTEKHGVTYRLKEIFLSEFKEKADIKIDGAEVLAGWESEVDATTADVAEFIKKNA
mgnify:CR=1 FL=1